MVEGSEPRSEKNPKWCRTVLAESFQNLADQWVAAVCVFPEILTPVEKSSSESSLHRARTSQKVIQQRDTDEGFAESPGYRVRTRTE